MIAQLFTAVVGPAANSSENLPHAADHLALFLLGTVVLTYGTLAAWGFLLWRRSRRPRAPHEELIACVQNDTNEEARVIDDTPEWR